MAGFEHASRRIEEIMKSGLHGYLTDMIVSAAELGQAIEAFYIRA